MYLLFITDQRIAAIHDHSNYKDTVGMGELIAVLNGVEFRTRHNDYKMARPSTTSEWFGQTEAIPYPEVPPAVSATIKSFIMSHVQKGEKSSEMDFCLSANTKTRYDVVIKIDFSL